MSTKQIKLQPRADKQNKNSKIDLETREMIYDRLSFNFSFITKKRQYGLDNLEPKVYKKFVNIMQGLSGQNIVSVLNLQKENGFEFIDSLKHEIVHTDFVSTGRFDKCVKGYCVFRLAKLGRVIGKLHNNMFYVIAVDTQFELYDH